MRSFWNRPLGSKAILVLTVVFLLELLAPWQRVCQVTGGDQDDPRVCGWVTGYAGLGVWPALLALAILVWETLPVLLPRLSMRGWQTAAVTAGLSIALTVATLVKMIEDNEFQTIWAWVGLGLVLSIMLIAILRVRHRWGMRGRDEGAGGAAAA